jgi:hypothetical protein
MAIQYFKTKPEAEAVPNAQVSWHIVKDGKPWAAATGEDIVADLRPTVTKWQLVQACADAGIAEAQIDTAVATLTPKRQRFWKYTNVIDRDNPFSSGLRSNLVPVPTPQTWNAIFVAAAALDPLRV